MFYYVEKCGKIKYYLYIKIKVIKGENSMSDEIFNIFAAVGIGLTFFASVAATIVSIISLKSSNETKQHSDYLSIITINRAKWSEQLRKNASLYFTQVTRLCSGQETDYIEIYNELTRYHFAIVLLLFEQQDKEFHDNMSVVRSKATEIVSLHKKINQRCKELDMPIDYMEDDDVVVDARQKIEDLKYSIQYKYQGYIFDSMIYMLEKEWIKQKKRQVKIK